jgi:hypothetical protein
MERQNGKITQIVQRDMIPRSLGNVALSNELYEKYYICCKMTSKIFEY